MRPHHLAATRENSSRAPSAFWKLPGPGRPPAPCPRSGPILALAPRIVRPPPPTPALYAGHAACDAVDGGETSVLPEPRSAAYDTTVLLESESINRFFHVGHAIALTPAPSASLANPLDSLCGERPFRPRLECGELPPRDRAAQPISLHSRRSGPGGGSEKWGGQIAARSGSPKTTQRANQPRG